MKLKAIRKKYITMEDIYNSASKAESKKFVDLWSSYGYRFFDKIPVNTIMIKYAMEKPCFVKWLLSNYLVEKVEEFTPFTIEIPINSPEEYWEVWHRMNADAAYFDKYMSYITRDDTNINFTNKNSTKLWRYVDNIGIKNNLK